MQYPKISIVTPSFNQGKYIEQTICSIVNQGYPNLEYIIIDGGSTDNTIQIIKKYESKITYWISEPDNGQSDAIQKGLLKSTGYIFNWINSDDYLEPFSLFKIAEAFNSNIDIFCGYARIFNDIDNYTVLNHRTNLYPILEQTFVEKTICQPGMFYKKSIIHELGGINLSLHYIMDLELWWRYLAKHGQSNIYLSNEKVAHFRMHISSKTVTNDLKFRSEENIVLYHFSKTLNLPASCSNYFYNSVLYSPPKWNYEIINKKLFQLFIANKYLYIAYQKKDILFSKFALKNLFINGKMSFSFQTLAIFVKVYIGDISFRKYFHKNA